MKIAAEGTWLVPCFPSEAVYKEKQQKMLISNYVKDVHCCCTH